MTLNLYERSFKVHVHYWILHIIIHGQYLLHMYFVYVHDYFCNYMIIRRAVRAVRLLPDVLGCGVLVDPACITIMCSIVLASIYGMLGVTAGSQRYLALTTNRSLASSMLKSSAAGDQDGTATASARRTETERLSKE